MAKVNKVAKEWATTRNELVPAALVNGKLRIATRTIEIKNGDSTDSRYHLGDFPPNSILFASSKLYHETITGTMVGKLGTVEDDDVLTPALNLASGNTKPIISDVKAIETGIPLWVRLGFTKQPNEDIGLYLTLANDAAGDCKACFNIAYAHE